MADRKVSYYLAALALAAGVLNLAVGNKGWAVVMAACVLFNVRQARPPRWWNPKVASAVLVLLVVAFALYVLVVLNDYANAHWGPGAH